VASRTRGDRSVDVYLFPAVVGGGLGDIAEVLDAGDWLRSAGLSPRLYRGAGRPLPVSVDARWGSRLPSAISRLRPNSPRALTVAPNWGVSAAPARDEPLGRAGPWAVEASEIETRYGARRTVHVSLEEFARTLPSKTENAERWREGGTSLRDIERQRKTKSFRTDTGSFHTAFRRFRGFDRPNVLHLFQTFAASRPFAREFPEVVQVGPLWPHRASRAGTVRRTVRGRWVWYASPSSSDHLVRAIDEGLQGTRVREVVVRSPREIRLPSDSSVQWTRPAPLDPATWGRAFDTAGLRIVTGSRTLLEALALGRPFLYYNGTMGEGIRRRRHRPEKVQALLRVWGTSEVDAGRIRDLADFSRGRRVAEVVRAAATDPLWSAAWPAPPRALGVSPGRAEAGPYLVRLAREWASGAETSDELVARHRSARPGVKVQDG
jgi:hypothetical protein